MIRCMSIVLGLTMFSCGSVCAHDTTHVHPLMSLEIAKLIKDKDITSGAKAYADIYEPNPVSIEGVDDSVNFLYWGTDFDPVGMADAIATNKPLSEYLVKDRYEDSDGNDLYSSYNNVIDGVVNEDRPVTNVVNHFYQAESGISLTLLIVTPTAFGESGRVPFWTGID